MQEYAPAQIKQSVTGSGRATKDQMQRMVKRLLSLERKPASDAADAHCKEPEARQRIADEMADVGISLLMLADRTGIDLLEAMRSKLKKNGLKYPVEP